MKWFFIPFADYSEDTAMPGNVARYQRKYGAGVTVVGLNDSLANVKPADTLIIAGHGLPKNENIGVFQDPFSQGLGMMGLGASEERMTANDLAKLLQTMHLPVGHVFVKTVTCGGAGLGTVGNNGKLMDLNHEACFASVLALSLGKRGYEKIMVRGYAGFVNATQDKKTVTMKWGGDPNTPNVRQAEYFVGQQATYPTSNFDEIWFNAKGERMWDITVSLMKNHYSR